MTRVDTPQTRCRAGFARGDITPPVGIYHRMWGAATHDTATGVHRPLAATALWLEALNGSGRQVVIGLDHCLLESTEVANIRAKVSVATGIPAGCVQVSLSHTHGAGWMSRSRAHLPGGEHVGPYLDRVAAVSAEVAARAAESAKPSTILYGTSRCSLAAHRDMWDATTKQYVCGFNPGGPIADDTVLVAAVTADSGLRLGTVVNYACHPTTLAWENTLISPDYVGAMREVIERHTGVPCLFLQGASGEIGPREGYVGDVGVADRNGRQLGFAALSGLEALPPPGTRFEYAGPVVSGAVLGTWRHQPLPTNDVARNATWNCRTLHAELPYRIDLPTLTETREKLTQYTAEEAAASDPVRKRDFHALVEQMNRQVARLTAIPEGKAFPLPVEVWTLGGAVWVFTPGELYQSFQTTLRQRFPRCAVVIATISNGWQPGYLPAASSYGYGIYQETIAAVGPGALEALTETVARAIAGAE